jgi:hypothetical protein
MQILCATTLAATEVAGLLLRANLIPAYHFRVEPVFETVETIRFTLREPLPDKVLEQIAAVPETQIIYPA